MLSVNATGAAGVTFEWAKGKVGLVEAFIGITGVRWKVFRRDIVGAVGRREDGEPHLAVGQRGEPGAQQ